MLLDNNPGLAPKRKTLFEQASRIARREAAIETQLPSKHVPIAVPFTLEAAELQTDWPPGVV